MTKQKKRGLGRGLGALIPTDQPVSDNKNDEAAGLRHVPVAAIRPNPKQPRSHFDPEALAELSASIAEHGLIQPLIVAVDRQEDGYILIAGERRWRASQQAGLISVPVVVKDATPQEMLELAIIENVQRADLNPLEEAEAYQQLMDEFGMTQEEVAVRVGKSRPAVANMVRLLELPENIREAVILGQITSGHARTLLPLQSAAQQTAVMNSILQGGWSVRRTEEVVRKLLTSSRPAKRIRTELPAEIADLAKQFERELGTRVSIEHSLNGGKVVLHYYSDEELQAIYEQIIGAE